MASAAPRRVNRRPHPLTRHARLLTVLTAVGLAPSVAAQADDPVVVRVGGVELKKSDVERRIARVPDFQLKHYGKSPDEIKRQFIERDLVPEVLYSLDVKQQELESSPTVRAELRSAKLQALQTALAAELKTKQPVTEADIAAYYKEHEKRFKTPERIKLWRILVGSEAEAQAVLKQAKAKGDVKTWSTLAREKSLDKATHMRDGELGFVLPDGRTSVPRVEVDPALFAAAAPLKNGEFVDKPVPEGKNWAVVWRRGSLAAVERTLEQESPSIRRLLERERTTAQLDALVEKLTQEHVSRRDDALLENVALDKIGTLGAGRKPGFVEPHKPEGTAKPAESGAGKR